MDLIADIGATSTRCGLLDDRGGVARQQTYANDEFTDLTALLNAFLAAGRATDRPRRAALAVAAPVVGDEIAMLNRPWRFRQTALQATLDVAKLIVINDFAAVGWALPAIDADRRVQIGHGTPAKAAAMGVLGPGSGLGVGGLIPADEGWAALSGEGGHVSLTAATDLEARIIDAVRAEYGHCSAERLLSGPGLVRIYLELAKIRGRESRLTDPAEVTALASRGEPLATEVMGLFFGLLGAVAGDLALTLGARGGIFVAGGIVPRVRDMLARSAFRERFVAKGRYRDYLDRVPTYLITDPVPAFLGLRTLLGYR